MPLNPARISDLIHAAEDRDRASGAG